jgi:hypothetical protein
VDVKVAALNGETPLHSLISSSVRVGASVVDRAAVLLNAGADVNARDEKGTTPLHLACAQWSAPLVKLFLERGAVPTARDQARISCVIALLLQHNSLYYQNWNQLMIGEEKGFSFRLFFLVLTKKQKSSRSIWWWKSGCRRVCTECVRSVGRTRQV